MAVKVFSPPDNNDILESFFPGGEATISTPVSKMLLASVNFKSALPPLNSSLKVIAKFLRIISKVLINSFSITLSISFIMSKRVTSALAKSSRCPIKNS